MIVPLALLVVLFAPFAVATAQDPALARPEGTPPPAALHLSSFASMRAARLNADGSLDSGAGVLTLLDGETGEPLSAETLHYGPMPDLWASFKTKLHEADIEVRALAVPVSRGGDERVKASVRVAISNRGTEPLHLELAASLRPGGGDALQRPYPSVEHKPANVFAQEGNLITRDGQALLSWIGVEPQVTVKPGVTSPDEEVARLEWDIEVSPGNARLIELALAGPPAKKTVDESAFRDGFKAVSYAASEEQLGWQAGTRGHWADIQVHDVRLWYAMDAALHQLRALGDADKEVRAFSDRPFGHPASDGAVEPEILGVFADWGFGDWVVNFHNKLLAEAVARGKDLPPERRVALVHGLARSVRLGVDMGDMQTLAGAIHALVDASTEGAPVRPWLDPELVRQDLQAILDSAPPLQGYALPNFAWAQPAEGSREAEFLAARRAVSAHDGAEAWRRLAPLIASTNVDGFGSMQPGGVSDAGWSLALMSILRDMIFDDHGADLHLFPAMGRGMIPDRGAFEVPLLPTRFGPVKMEQYLVAKKLFGTQVVRMGSRQPRLSLWHLPTEFKAEEVRGVAGGQATLRPDGTVDCIFDPTQPKGLRFNVRLTEAH